jgi:hypothetical protein
MDPGTIAGLIQGASSLYNTFGRNNPSRAAGKELGKIEGYGRDAYNPFIQQGQNATNQLSPQYQQMAGNPTDFYNNIMNQYKPSAGYQYQENKLNSLAKNTAAAGGYGGTPGAVSEHSELINQLLGGDMQQFLQNILGIQGQGQQGLENQVGRGFQASGNLADYLGTNSMMQAGNQFSGQRQQNENRNTGLSSLASLINNKGKYVEPQQQQPDIMKLLSSLFGGGKSGASEDYRSLNEINSFGKGSNIANWGS